MKKKALVLAVCMAFATPSISTAKALPSNLVGLSLGEIQSQSHLNEPFRGQIPILFTDVSTSKKLTVRLAPHSIFKKVGAEKLPILNHLSFHITTKNHKPIIVVKSVRPIQMPFLNFVLEIKSDQGTVYQDFTTLLDPRNKTSNHYKNGLQLQTSLRSSLTHFASPQKSKHKVQSGDTLSQIAFALKTADTSLKRMVTAIHQKNPNAFVNNNINKLKKGAVLSIPTQKELKNASFKAMAAVAFNKSPHHKKTKKLNAENFESHYTVKSGDTLSAITKKYLPKGISFTKMMTAIHTANPHAFSKNKINQLKVNEILNIPSFKKAKLATNNASKKEPVTFVNPNLIVLEDISTAEQAKEFKLDGFVIEKGDTLLSVAEQIGYKNIPVSNMMKAIYETNPDAFEKNNITMLIEGAIIRLPSIDEIKKSDGKKLNSETKTQAPIQNNSAENSALNQLEKRVRELKRDLNKANINFEKLESTLSSKEALIKEQSISLQKLATTLELVNDVNYLASKSNTQAERKSITKDLSPLKSPKKAIIPSEKKTSSQPAPAKNKKLSLEEELLGETGQRGYISPNLGNKFNQLIKSNLVDYNKYMSDKELLSTILALLLGLLLVRYRREIYAYTNISYDYPKYYPPLNGSEARKVLKEKSITFHDTLFNDPENQNPVFDNGQIEECEDLVEELIDDLNDTTNEKSDDWKELNQACDDYLEEFRSKSSINSGSADNIDTNSETNDKSEEMTFELFEALAEGIVTKSTDSNIYNFENKTAL